MATRNQWPDNGTDPIDEPLPRGTRLPPQFCCDTCGKPLPYYDCYTDGDFPGEGRFCGRCFQARIDECDAQIARGDRNLLFALVGSLIALVAVLFWSVS